MGVPISEADVKWTFIVVLAAGAVAGILGWELLAWLFAHVRVAWAS